MTEEVPGDIGAWMDVLNELERSGALHGAPLRVADGFLALALRCSSAVFLATTRGIARFSGYSESTTRPVANAVDALIGMGLIEQDKGHGNKPSTYRLVVPGTARHDGTRHDSEARA